MKILRMLLISAPLLSVAVGCRNEDGARVEPDNTAVNERDANGNTATPFDQSNDQADLDLAAKIRSEVVNLDNLSISGQNVKIITNQGKVILRGPVATRAEKDAIERIAVAAAGDGKVSNNLEVDSN